MIEFIGEAQAGLSYLAFWIPLHPVQFCINGLALAMFIVQSIVEKNRGVQS